MAIYNDGFPLRRESVDDGSIRSICVRNGTPGAMPDDEQEASVSGATRERPIRVRAKSAKVYGPEWDTE